MKRRILLFVFGLIFISLSAYAQRSVSGLVTNSSGKGLGGVSVQEKGKSNQTVTNSTGKFTITVANDAILVFDL